MKSYFDTIISLWRAEDVLFQAYFLHKYQLYSYRNKKRENMEPIPQKYLTK